MWENKFKSIYTYRGICIKEEKMKKVYRIFLLLLIAALIVGCSNSTKESVQDAESTQEETVQIEPPVKEEQAEKAKIENLSTPALLFFFTGVSWDYCQSQLVELQKNKELFSQFPGEIYAVSTSSEEEHNQLKTQLKLDYQLVSDPDFEIIGKANLKDTHDSHEPQSLRGFAVIDETGNIIHSQEVDPFGEEAAGIIPFAAEKLSAKQ